jgi:hypothetical protein
MNWLRKHWINALLIIYLAAVLVGSTVIALTIAESDAAQKLVGWIQYGLTHIPEPPK